MMPGFDRTGPAGEGEMTGRGRGMCATDEPETVGRFLRRDLWFGRGLRRGAPWGRGAGRGLGLGRGRGWWR